MIPGDSGNYNTYIIDVAKNTLVLGEPDKPASGLMFYYGTSDFPYVRGFAGFEVEMDVIIYTYRSNNLAFAVYYVGGPAGITANLNEAQKVDVAKTALKLPVEVYKADQTLTLANKSDDVNITWAFKDVADANNGLVNLTDGKVTLPASGQKDVKLVATLTLGETTTTKDFTVKVGVLPVSTAAQLASTTNNTYRFKIVGTVIGYNGYRQISIADATGAVTVYTTEVEAASLALLIGKQVEIIGTRTVFNGLVQLGSPEVKNLELDGTVPEAKALSEVADWNAKTLLPFQANLVSASNLKVTAIGVNTYGNVDLTLYDETSANTIKFYWDARQPLVGLPAFIEGLKVGDYVTFENALLTWRSSNPVIAIHNANQAKAGVQPVLTEAQKALVDAKLLTVEASTSADLVLPATLPLGSTVVWSSSHPAIIANDGKFTQPELNVIVTLTAVVTNGAGTKTVTFKVTAKEPEGALVLVNTFDFGTTNKTGYGAGNLVFSNSTGPEYTLKKDRVQLNSSTFEPWADSAVFLVLAPTSAAKFSFIQFDLTAETYAKAKKIEFDFATWNQNNFDQTVALAGSSLRVEKLVGETWVTVGADMFAELTKDALTTVSIGIEGAGMYRLVYELPNAIKAGNTDYAMGVDNLKIYVTE